MIINDTMKKIELLTSKNINALNNTIELKIFQNLITIQIVIIIQ